MSMSSPLSLTEELVLVGLLRATGIMERLLSASEYLRLRARIDQAPMA
jgi:hypothetical protein